MIGSIIRHAAFALSISTLCTLGERVKPGATSLLQASFSRDHDGSSRPLNPIGIEQGDILTKGGDGIAGFHELVEEGETTHKGCSQKYVTFDEFVKKHNRKYKSGSEEYSMRRKLFEGRVQVFQQHNCGSGRRLWTAGVTALTDRTDMELAKLRGRKGHHHGVTSGGKVPTSGGTTGARLAALSIEGYSHVEKLRPMPDTYDGWTELPAMQEIIDQGSCGSCWASASAAMLRAHSNIYHTQDMNFSVQQLVSCVPNPESCGGTGGCNGSTGELALDYVMHNGLTTADQFAYMDLDSTQGIPCPDDKIAINKEPVPQPNGTAFNRLQTLSDNESVIAAAPLINMPADEADESDFSAAQSFGMMGWSRLPVNKLEPLYRAVYQEGPVAVSITATYAWNYYVYGIMDNCTQDDMVVNHLVVLIGWGVDYDKGDTIRYWTLQNSWGTSWGENGFIRMIRQPEDQQEEDFCGWDNDPQIGTACEGGPSRVWVCGSCGILYDNVVAHFEGNTSMAQEMVDRRM